MISQPPQQPMTLTKLVDAYVLEHDLAESTIQQYRFHIRILERFAPGFTVADFSDEFFNRWLQWLSESKRARKTVKSYRGSMLTLWRFAFESGYCEFGPLRVKRIRLGESIPQAWTADQLEKLLAAADNIQGDFRMSGGIRRSLWWRAFILISWDTALRLGDVVNLRWSDIAADNRLFIVQAKTGHVIQCQLRPETIDAINGLPWRNRETHIVPLWGNRKSFCVAFTNLRKAAGLRGSSKWIRRSSATAVEAIMPGSAMRHLGHKTYGLAYKHYVDPRQINDNRPLPPAIGLQRTLRANGKDGAA